MSFMSILKTLLGIILLLTSCARLHIDNPGFLNPVTLDDKESPTTVETGSQEFFVAHNFIPLIIKTYSIPTLPPLVSWQIQYSGDIDLDLNVEVYNLDLFETSSAAIQQLHQRKIFVMCYFSAGTYEDWRPDASQFPSDVLGNEVDGWQGERWLDIRQIEKLTPIMNARLDLAVQKGCDGVDPDNVNGYENDSGFALTAEDQLIYNRFLSYAAHEHNLAVGLKNDLHQVEGLVSNFEWIINEECFTYQECVLLNPFIEAGKPVFVIEYDLAPENFCPQAVQLGFNALQKHKELDAYRLDCRKFVR
ncbi:MAG: endo alpha-1,4 polygalactosaminidase [Anaerolineales bacterium]